MTKLIIQIPCFNEELTLETTLSALPRHLPGIDTIEWLVINDGSRDRTVAVAKDCGVDHIVSFSSNQGLAKAFMAGLEASLRAGADIIVNTDADNQYCADDIPKLIQPILLGQADMVIGARPIWKTKHFSYLKKVLQNFGSSMVRLASNTTVPDAPSGFRAFSREAAMQLNVFNNYTYTLETIIQAGQKGLTIASVPIRTNPNLRKSRLVKSIPSYVVKSSFAIVGAVPCFLGGLLGLRWLLLFWFVDPTRSRAPSLILAAVLILIGFQLWMLGLVADLMAANRKLLEETRVRLRRLDLDKDSLDR
jgi:glycosyltransferase involved in cell wall biosynthesis